MGHHLADLGTVLLVGRRVEQQRDGRDQRSAVVGAEHDALAARRRGKGLLPEAARVLGRQRMHEVHRAARRHCLDQEVGERVEHLRRSS
jgi:hypothetical protein